MFSNIVIFLKKKLGSETGAGFTIVEWLVVIAIIALFSIILISNFPQTKLQFALSRVAYKFAQDVRRSQNMALAAVQYKDSSGKVQATSGDGVYADLGSLGNQKYLIYADSSPGDQQYDTLDFVVETIDFSASEPGVVIKEIDNVSGNKVSINLNVADLKTTITQLNPGQNSVSVVFALSSDATKTKTVSVNTSGLVEVK